MKSEEKYFPIHKYRRKQKRRAWKAVKIFGNGKCEIDVQASTKFLETFKGKLTLMK